MPTLAPSALRTRVAAGLEAVATWTESRWAPGLFLRDTDHLLHHGFAVAVEATQPHPSPGRQRPELGVEVVSTVIVQWGHRLRADAQVADYGAALDAEAAAIVAVLGISQVDLHLTWEGSRRDTRSDGWLVGSLTFRAIHRLALA